MDWQIIQAIGTWFTGLALALFAYLTFRLSKRQQQLLYSAELRGFPRYDPPKMGSTVFTKRDNSVFYLYDGIAWEVILLNPSSLLIAVTSFFVSIKSIDTGRSRQIWPGDYCEVFMGASDTKDIVPATPRFSVPAGTSSYVRSVVISDPRINELIEEITVQNRKIALEINVLSEVAGRTGNSVITSQEFTLPSDVHFGTRIAT